MNTPITIVAISNGTRIKSSVSISIKESRSTPPMASTSMVDNCERKMEKAEIIKIRTRR